MLLYGALHSPPGPDLIVVLRGAAQTTFLSRPGIDLGGTGFSGTWSIVGEEGVGGTHKPRTPLACLAKLGKGIPSVFPG